MNNKQNGKENGSMERYSAFSKGMEKTKREITALLSVAVAIDRTAVSVDMSEASADSHTIRYTDPTCTFTNKEIPIENKDISATYSPLLRNIAGLATSANWNASSNGAVYDFIDDKMQEED